MSVYRVIGKAVRFIENREGKREPRVSIIARIIRADTLTRAKQIASQVGFTVIESAHYVCRNYESNIGSESIYDHAVNTEEGVL